MILELSNWGRMYAEIIADYDTSSSIEARRDAIEELGRLREQLWISEFEAMDESEQVEALLSLGTLEMDHNALAEGIAVELVETLEQDITGDISRWDRQGPTTPDDRYQWRRAIWERLAEVYPALAPDPAPPDTRLRELPEDPTDILF